MPEYCRKYIMHSHAFVLNGGGGGLVGLDFHVNCEGLIVIRTRGKK
jgi:hypothetical protein